MSSVLSLGLGVLVVSVVLGGAVNPIALLNNPSGLAMLVLSSLFGFVGQCLINRGLQLCQAGHGSLIRNLDVPVAYLLGLVFLGERPSWYSFAGSFLVVGSALMIGIRQMMNIK